MTYMKISSRNIQQLVIASALASGLVSAGVAASAQTTSAPHANMTCVAATTGLAANATNVSAPTVDSKVNRQSELEQANADARRMEFRNSGTSL
jgi:hypothetical protein